MLKRSQNCPEIPERSLIPSLQAVRLGEVALKSEFVAEEVIYHSGAAPFHKMPEYKSVLAFCRSGLLFE